MSLIDSRLFLRLNTIGTGRSLQDASRYILIQFRISLKITGSIPQKGPLLLISTHPGGIDSWVVTAAVDRNDLHLVALASYARFGPIIKNNLYPIYRQQKPFEPIFLKIFDVPPIHINNNQNKCRVQNRASITTAAQHISAGGSVLIFPTGTGGKQPIKGQWKVGIGFLAKQIHNHDTQVVFCQIDGTSPADLIRYLNPSLRSIFAQPKTVTITISRPAILSDIVDLNLNGKQIAGILESKHASYF